MFNITKVEHGLISDADMYLFLEKGMRGRVCCISKRYNNANNKSLKSYDPRQQSKHIIYSDAINLHVYAMCKLLPTRGFK